MEKYGLSLYSGAANIVKHVNFIDARRRRQRPTTGMQPSSSPKMRIHNTHMSINSAHASGTILDENELLCALLAPVIIGENRNRLRASQHTAH